MATDLKRGIERLILSFTASGAVPANRFVAFDGTLCGDGAAALGVARDTCADGDPGDAVVEGVMPVTCSENISAGAQVSSDANGKAKNAGSGNEVLGYAYASANSGDPVDVILSHAGTK